MRDPTPGSVPVARKHLFSCPALLPRALAKERDLSTLRSCLAASLLLCSGFASAQEIDTSAKNGATNDGANTLESQGPSRFHDQPIVVEGYLFLPADAAKGEYRVRMFDSESSFILKLSDD